MEPTVKGRKRTQVSGLDQKEELNIQPEQNEEIRNKQKNEERLRNLLDIFKHSNIQQGGEE